jgi:holo-[acyl-carrier protein] synthase
VSTAHVAIALGVDLIEVERVAQAHARHPRRFLSRHFTVAEQAECAGNVTRLAARWAAKEAAAKALGTGIGLIGWHEVEINCGENGAPRLSLHGAAASRAQSLGIEAWSVSLSHTAGHAVAVVAGAPGRG